MKINQEKLQAIAVMLFLSVERAQSVIADQTITSDKESQAMHDIFTNTELVSAMAEVRKVELPQFKDCRAISKQIESMAWGKDTLIVKFLTGASYQYAEVPVTVWQQLLDAKSPGTELNASVKGVYKFSKL